MNVFYLSKQSIVNRWTNIQIEKLIRQSDDQTIDVFPEKLRNCLNFTHFDFSGYPKLPIYIPDLHRDRQGQALKGAEKSPPDVGQGTITLKGRGKRQGKRI